jgi:ribonuclease HI
MYRLFTDGACKGNPGPGGWAYLLTHDERPGCTVEQAGSAANTTNNRMEVMAIIEGLRQVPDEAKVEITTDSRYAITVASSRNPKLKNPDLVLTLRHLLARLDFHFTHVKGHSGHPENEHVDKLASAAAKGQIGCRSMSA